MPRRRQSWLPDALMLLGSAFGVYLLAYVFIAIFAIRPTLRHDFWLLGMSSFVGCGALLLRKHFATRHLNDKRRGFSVDPPRQAAPRD